MIENIIHWSLRVLLVCAAVPLLVIATIVYCAAEIAVRLGDALHHPRF